ncbi:hypothetical protein DFJ74DRAFT_709341 [Hyaloraphidium curvatum]|nr:hypothetical protein DFJ74DRAFT_709341 [Hyaloraphidium curvatum]
MAASKSVPEPKPTAGQLLEFYARASAFAGLSTVAFVFSSLVAAPLAWLVGDPQKANQATRFMFEHFVGPLVGISFEVEGMENLDPSLDVLIIARLFPRQAVVMAKHTLAWAPFLGWYLAMAGHAFVRRRDHITGAKEDAEQAAQEHANAMATMKNVTDKMMKENVGLVIFPEGTRAHMPTPKLLPFKKGAFRVAIETGSPIVPVVISNYAHLYDSRAKRFHSGTIRVRVLPPIETKGLKGGDVEKLLQDVQSLMQRNYVEISPVRAKL